MVEFANKVFLVMQEPVSDEEVEMDCYTSVQRVSRLADGLVAKSKAILKTFDIQLSGLYSDEPTGNTSKSALPMMIPLDGPRTIWGCPMSWLKFVPVIGASDIDFIQGRDTVVVDGVKVSLSCHIPMPMSTDFQTYDGEPRQRCFIDLLYVPYLERDVYDIGFNVNSFLDFYNVCKDKDQLFNVFLRQSAIAKGVKILKRWRFTLDRKCVVGHGREYDSCVWAMAGTDPTGLAPIGSGGDTAVGAVGLESQYLNTTLGERAFLKSYAHQPTDWKNYWAPYQDEIDQVQSFFHVDEYVKVNRSVQIIPGASVGNQAKLCIRRGFFFAVTFCDIKEIGSVFDMCPVYAMNLRFKFREKSVK